MPHITLGYYFDLHPRIDSVFQKPGFRYGLLETVIAAPFTPPRILRPAWLQTVAPALVRRVNVPLATRETLLLADGDTLELAWYAAMRRDDKLSAAPHRGLVVLTHGLEGSYNSRYIQGLVLTFLNAGYLVLAWNMRGCGGVPNRLPSWYHSGQSSDLGAVINHARGAHPDLPIFAIGISIGGNILCKLLGECGASNAAGISAAVAVSAPLDLRGSAEVLAKPSRRLYMEYLLRPLRARIREKARRFPDIFTGCFDTKGIDSITTFHQFDARYTAPLHGFDSVNHYWDSCSGVHYLGSISTPLLIISAQDDPFLSQSCTPTQDVAKSKSILLETPVYGGHVGFIDSITMHSTWLERRALEFIEQQQQQQPQQKTEAEF
ncbi:MAG: YheT family hydrolase [Pseudomonadota bacterium]